MTYMPAIGRPRMTWREVRVLAVLRMARGRPVAMATLMWSTGMHGGEVRAVLERLGGVHRVPVCGGRGRYWVQKRWRGSRNV